ncbi:PAS/PAC sensor-containing diguanylate cyclase [Rhodanobacter sp. Root179]|jgi:diguanylate cyclase (GGDEF)-like protein/PAS domain S-box-containing protein|uniref:GGDEF domain-containing protein n=1 Tax=Rhodanobacter sp. Root179 TaxID=1736482 RepID=UPI0006F8CB4D|nr:sensor domain-containing diguanylate cyclase [Rhodanobacter sp. Root179]KRB41057.1 diguanylate cyclase [Rhodanobacter sp. Root179]
MADFEKLEPDSTVYRTLLESTKAIPWKIDWDSKQFAYIGPQIEALLGWTPASWQTVGDWASRMHPQDREWVLNFCVAQSQAGVDHEADYRALTRDGHYVWIRDVVHVVRRADGSVDSLIGFMFDISERKQTEQKLASLQKELEELSFRDGLTGVANRRRFDALMELEWSNARRNRQPLSLLMIDIDYFKQYNDCYGHLEGDACLKRVAWLLASAATRARDLLARFGGEEFVLLLPETDEAASHKLAARCRDLILAEQIPHAQSAVGPVLTISLGAATCIPAHADELRGFLDSVDKRLYRAKQQGRDCIVAAS